MATLELRQQWNSNGIILLMQYYNNHCLILLTQYYCNETNESIILLRKH